ncbi:MAG: tripartite tricarboxylate transporter substrate binding protein [Pseudomonadota bacterium]
MFKRRRQCLAWAAATAWAPALRAAPPAPLPLLRICIPGGAGGGWDQTGRALGEAVLAAGLAQKVACENKPGKGGTIGLADFVQRFDRDPAALLVGGMVMVGAIAASQAPVHLGHVTPLARLTNDYLALVVAAGSRLSSLKALAAELQRNVGGIIFSGGSLGGVDHMLAGMLVRQLRLDAGALRYQPATAAEESLAMLASGQAQVVVSGYSELKAGIDARRLVALAVSSRRGLHGIPSLSEQGVPIELSNWRGVFGPAGITDAQKQALRELVLRAAESAAWQQSLVQKGWIGALLAGRAFEQALEVDQSIASVVAHMLKLKG